jgi:predicted permease
MASVAAEDGMIHDLLEDLRHALRGLRRRPGFAILVMLSLGLGMGANGAIFSLVDFVFLRPLPVRDPAGLVLFSDAFAAGTNGGTLEPGPQALYSWPLFRMLRARNAAFQQLAAQQSGGSTRAVHWRGHDDEVELADGRAVTANYFTLLGVPAVLGRTFVPEDETAPGANPVVVLSHRFWQRLGARPVLGASLVIGPRSYTVVGVTAPGFAGTRVGIEETDFWVPMTMQADLMKMSLLDDPRQAWLVVLGRLPPAISLAAAEGAMNGILQHYLRENPALVGRGEQPQAVRIALVSGRRGISPLRQAPVRNALVAVMAGVGLLLLVVGLNLSHLLLARAIEREREMVVRQALGATRGRLVRQLLAEALLLSLLGTAAGALATVWLIDALVAMVSGGLPLALDVRIDGRAVAFLAALGAGMSLLLGLLPAWHLSERSLLLPGSSAALGGGVRRRRLGRLLLTSQVVVSMVLLVAAGLLTGTLRHLRAIPSGVDDQHLLLVELKPHLAGFTEEGALPFYDDVLRRVRALPAVRAAALSRIELFTGGHATDAMSVDGVEQPAVEVATVTADYFEALGMAVRQGRGLTAADRRDAPPVAVINESLARRSFGPAPLGRRLRLGDAPALEVVGVVSDVKNDGLGNPALPTVYLPVTQHPQFLAALEVRAAADPAPLAEAVRRAVRAAHGGVPVVGVRTMRAQIELSLTGSRVLATLAGAFGLAALLLVCVGLHGVMSRWTAQRTPEIGVRMALGADAAAVRRMVLRQALLLVVAGLLVGAAAGLAVARLLRAFLYGVSPLDPLPVALAAGTLVAVAALSAYLPARRASRVDPVAALRAE